MKIKEIDREVQKIRMMRPSKKAQYAGQFKKELADRLAGKPKPRLQ